ECPSSTGPPRPEPSPPRPGPACLCSPPSTSTTSSTTLCGRGRVGSCSRTPLSSASPPRLVVADGGALFASSVTRRLIEEFANRPIPRHLRELETLRPR